MGLPWRDFLTLLRPSRRLMGIRDEPGILGGACCPALNGGGRGLKEINKSNPTCNGRSKAGAGCTGQQA